MKKLTALLLILCLLFSACGTDRENSLKDEIPSRNTSAAAETAVPKAVYDDSLLQEITAEGDCLSNDGARLFSFSYTVPQILDDTKEADSFNESMTRICTDAESGFSIPYEEISWKHFWNGDLLSLCIRMRYPFESTVVTLTYNYDFTKGRSITNEELLERLGCEPEDAGHALRRAAAKIADEQIMAGFQQAADFLPGLLELRCQTISFNNLNIYGVPLYLDGEGALHCCTNIGVPAGGGFYAEDLTVDMTPPQSVRKKVSCEFITAELKDNAVTLTFRNEGLAGLFASPDAVQFDHPYPVEGLYGTYTDIALGFVGNGGYAYLVLTDTEGRVTFCDIMTCMNVGCRFFGSGPLPQLEDVSSFAVEGDADGSSILAVSSSGRAVDLYDILDEMSAVLPYLLQDTVWYSADGTYSLSLSGDSPLTGFGAGGGMLATGLSLRYLGMSEFGMHYYCPMTTEEGDFVTFLLSLEPLTPFGSFESGYTLRLTQTFGPAVSGFESGDPMLLFPAVG